MLYTKVLRLEAPISMKLPSKGSVVTASMLQACVVVGTLEPPSLCFHLCSGLSGPNFISYLFKHRIAVITERPVEGNRHIPQWRQVNTTQLKRSWPRALRRVSALSKKLTKGSIAFQRFGWSSQQRDGLTDVVEALLLPSGRRRLTRTRCGQPTVHTV